MHKWIFTLMLFCLSGLVLQSQTSYTLEEALAKVEEDNRSIRRNAIEVEKAKQQIKILRASGLPQVNGKINYNYYVAPPVSPVEDFITPSIYGVLIGTGLLPPSADPGPPQTFEFGFVPRNVLTGDISANWVVFDGSYLVSLEAARLYEAFTLSNLDTKMAELKANVTKAYLNVMLAEINKETLINNIGILEKSLAESQAIYAEGFIEQLDVKRIEMSLSNLQSELIKIDEVIALSKNLLKFYIEHPMDEEISVSDDLKTLVGQLKTDADIALLEFDVAQRPELQEIALGRALQELDVKRYQRGYYPTASVFASGQESLQRDNLFDNDELGLIPTVVVGFNINVPIYDGGRKKAQIQNAKLELERIDLDKKDFEDNMNLQFLNAKTQFLNARVSLDAAEKSLALTEEILRTAQIKYKEGVGSSLEVTQAESSLYQSQSSYMNAIYNLVNAKADLDIIMGTL